MLFLFLSVGHTNIIVKFRFYSRKVLSKWVIDYSEIHFSPKKNFAGVAAINKD